MKTKLRFLSLILAIVMCFSMLVACSDDEEKKGKKETEKTEETDKSNEKEEGKKPFVKVDPEKDPHGAVAGAFTLLGESYGGKLSDVSAVLEKAASDTGSYDFEFEMDGVEAGVSAVVDTKNALTSATVKAGYEGFSAKANLWLGDDVVLQIPALLGDDAYGLKISTIENDLNKSPLLEAMGFESVDEMLEDLAEEFEAEVGFGLDEFIEAFGTLFDTAAAEKAGEDFGKTISEAAREIKADVAAEKIGDKDGYKITFTVTPQNVKPIVEAYFAYYKDLYGSLLALTGADIDDSLEEALNSLDEAEGEEISFDVYLYKDSGKLAGLEFEFSESYEDEEEDYSYSSDESYKIEFSDDEIKLNVKNNSDSTYYTSSIETVLTYKAVNKDGKTGFEIEGENKSEYVSKGEDTNDTYDNVNNISFSFIKDKDGKFTLKGVADEEDVFTAKGTFKCDDKSVEIGIDSIEVEGEEVDFTASLTVKAGGKVEKTPEYTNLLSMTEADFEELAETAQNSKLYQEIEELYESIVNSDDFFDDEYFDDEYFDDEYFDDEYFDDEYFDDEYFDDEYYDDEYYF